MSTRSMIRVVEDGVTILNLYKQFDGYPEGLGRELAEFLGGLIHTEFLNFEPKGTANGMGCLAAQLVAWIKREPGDVYIYPTGLRVQVDYTYTVTAADYGTNQWMVEVTDFRGDAILPSAPLDEFAKFCGLEE